jgi:hypothetical protein
MTCCCSFVGKIAEGWIRGGWRAGAGRNRSAANASVSPGWCAVLGAGFLAASGVAIEFIFENGRARRASAIHGCPPDKTTFAGRQLALSPDGRQLAFVVSVQESARFMCDDRQPHGRDLLQGTEERSSVLVRR